jgi:hypothetical protein
MKPQAVDRERILGAWQGRISGCQLGKPVELLSMQAGRDALGAYLKQAEALPLRDYVPFVEHPLVAPLSRSCKGRLQRSEPDDDITYTVLGLMLLEQHGAELSTVDVARAWLRLLPAGAVFTAERAAYRTLVERTDTLFSFGAPPGFDLAECARNEWSEWIGAQIRADLYGWVCPGRPALAADLARRDAAHRRRDTRSGIRRRARRRDPRVEVARGGDRDRRARGAREFGRRRRDLVRPLPRG